MRALAFAAIGCSLIAEVQRPPDEAKRPGASRHAPRFGITRYGSAGKMTALDRANPGARYQLRWRGQDPARRTRFAALRPVPTIDSVAFCGSHWWIRSARYRSSRFLASVFHPLGPGRDRRYATRVHDLSSDAVITTEFDVASVDAVVIFDATFIQNEALTSLWDEVIYLDVDEAAAVARGIARDSEVLGGPQATRDAYEKRYMAACRIYLHERDPRSRASIVIRHTDPDRPIVERIG